MQGKLSRQPWSFMYFAVFFGGLRYLFGSSLTGAVLGGLLFASLMSAWLAWRNRRNGRPLS